MAGKKISELQRLTEITGQELLPVAVGGQNYSILTSLLQGGGATKLNDYMYDVSLLMGKMAVRGTKGTSKNTPPYGNGYYNTDGEYVEGSANTFVDTILVEPGKVYHFDIGATDLSSLTNPAILVLFDEDDSVIQSVPLTAGGFRDKYLAFTSSVKKYGVTYMTSPTVQPQPPIYNETYEIEDVNDVLSNLSGKDSSMRDDFNNYISDVTDLFGKMAYRDGIGTDLANPIAGSYIRLSDGVLVQADDSYSYQYVDVDSTKCYHLQNLISGSTISMLALYDEDGGLIKSYRALIDGYFVFKGVSRIGLSGTTVSIQRKFTIQSFDIQDLTTVINTQQGNRALYVQAGAKYNEATGFYELNGLTDITEEQMRLIYNATNPVAYMNDRTAVFGGLNIRTNLPFVVQGGYKECPGHALFTGCRYLEVANLGSLEFVAQTISYAFRSCFVLRKITTIINVHSADLTNIFQSCSKLETVNLKKVSKNISFSDSPLISLESLQYLITNASNTLAITVTVHADVYAKIQDESQTEWHALIEAAAAKQITFATV